MQTINLYWEGGYSLSSIENNEKGNDENIDYGVYQIYGSHPIYGNDVLLYIGKAVQQTFTTRIKQEKHWWYNKDAYNIKIYLGRFIGGTPNLDNWNELISRAEELLIFTHIPAHNSSNINFVNELKLSNFHILNWGEYRSLMPEVSSMRVFDETKETNDEYFSMEYIN